MLHHCKYGLPATPIGHGSILGSCIAACVAIWVPRLYQ